MLKTQNAVQEIKVFLVLVSTLRNLMLLAVVGLTRWSEGDEESYLRTMCRHGIFMDIRLHGMAQFSLVTQVTSRMWIIRYYKLWLNGSGRRSYSNYNSD